jgi:hypothetical protein
VEKVRKKIKTALVFMALILLYSPGRQGSAANAPAAPLPGHKEDTVTFKNISLEKNTGQTNFLSHPFFFKILRAEAYPWF